MSIINNNIMAANVANTLTSHYGRLATSVQRLSSGLRINSAADDAAGLAIRELMRSDVAALSQGARNANDAISMLQVADGALAIIDEKLIRMKELAEQAATGTYSSAQRLMIASEYRAMAAEIDRIARGTDFNGIKLLDGSLTGAHNGKGLQSTGKMKIHFGAANDSAEDYYYVEIGDCTTKGLGLATAGGKPSTVILEKVEVTGENQMTLQIGNNYTYYYDPQTGKRYMTDGDFFFYSSSNPGGSRLDWETDREIIERLETRQKTKKTYITYAVFNDPQTGFEYFTKDGGKTFTADPYDPENKTLSPSNAAHKAILDRLVVSQKSLSVETVWKSYVDPNGQEYHTCDGGITYSPNVNNPTSHMLVSTNAADRELIASLKPDLEAETNTVSKQYYYEEYMDPVTTLTYYKYTNDANEEKYSSTRYDPLNTSLDPAKDQDIINRLVPKVENTNARWTYDIYRDPRTNIFLYSMDGGSTFVSDIKDPFSVVLVSPNDLEPVIATEEGMIRCDVFEDRAAGGKKYYSIDGGATLFDDLSNMEGSTLDKTVPGYGSFVASLEKVDTVVYFEPTIEHYYDSVTTRHYYTHDGGLTFWASWNDSTIALDSSNPLHADIINRLTPVIATESHTQYFDIYNDPVTRQKYYTPTNGNKDTFITDLQKPTDIALDKANAADLPIIDRLVPEIRTSQYAVKMPVPGKALIFFDETTNSSYFSWDGGTTIFSRPHPYEDRNKLNPNSPGDKAILDRLKPLMVSQTTTKYIEHIIPGEGGSGSISTQQAAQNALVAIDRAIVSKDQIRAHLGALQNRLENTVTNLNIQAENLQSAESRISDADIAIEMTAFVRGQVLGQAAVAMLGQANSFPHMLVSLLG